MREINVIQGICETLRLIYDRVYLMEDEGLKSEATELLIDAMIMAKKMSDRLQWYKDTYKPKKGSGGRNLRKLTDNRKRQIMRRERWEKENG